MIRFELTNVIYSFIHLSIHPFVRSFVSPQCISANGVSQDSRADDSARHSRRGERSWRRSVFSSAIGQPFRSIAFIQRIHRGKTRDSRHDPHLAARNWFCRQILAESGWSLLRGCLRGWNCTMRPRLSLLLESGPLKGSSRLAATCTPIYGRKRRVIAIRLSPRNLPKARFIAGHPRRYRKAVSGAIPALTTASVIERGCVRD